MDSIQQEITSPKREVQLDNIVRIPTSLNSDFFRYWFEFLSPFHRLTNREIQVIATISKHRYELSKAISDNKLLNKVLFSIETRNTIIKECNLNSQHYKVILSKLRKDNVIIGDSINPRFIPNIKENSNKFQLLLSFELDNTTLNKDSEDE